MSDPMEGLAWLATVALAFGAGAGVGGLDVVALTSCAVGIAFLASVLVVALAEDRGGSDS